MHGILSHGFPNHFATGFVQGGVTASTTLMFEQQADHIAYIIKDDAGHGRDHVEPSAAAEEAWIATIRANSFDNSNFVRECTPGYYNSEGEPNGRSFLGDPSCASIPSSRRGRRSGPGSRRGPPHPGGLSHHQRRLRLPCALRRLSQERKRPGMG